MTSTGNITLIIGNGFDINLGLKTSYTDYINSKYFKDNLPNNLLFKFLQDTFDNQKWIDIELLLCQYSVNKSSSNSEFKNEYNILCNSLKKYLESVKLSNFNAKSLSQINIKSKAFKLIEEYQNSDLTVIDFNYTDTVGFLLKSFLKSKNKFNHYKIHGSIEEDNIIFGVQDGIDINKCSFIRKSYSENYGIYNIEKILTLSDTILSFGYSFGKSDEMYFDNFFGSILRYNVEGKNLEFYYYNQKDDIFNSLENLSHINVGLLRTRHNLKFTLA